jgi:hypothetical protein
MRKVRRAVRVSFALITMISFAGCASIVAGGDQKVSIASDPSEASVKVLDSNGMTVFNSQTPAVAILKKGDGFFKGASYRIRIEKQGYKPQEVVLQSSLNAGWYLLGNLFIGGLIGWLIVDPMTGAMWSLAPENVSMELASSTSFLQQRDGLMVVLLQDLPSSLLPELQRIPLQN